LKGALAANQYDVIHAHSPHVALLFLLATVRNYQRLARSTVITVHDSYTNYKLRNRLLFLPVFAGFQRIVCCGLSSYKSFPAFYKRLAGGRFDFVGNGVDLSRVDRSIAQTACRHQPTDAFTVTAVGRLVDIKNPLTAVRAFGSVAEKTDRLVYMGDGLLRSALLAARREAGLDAQIEFTGLIPRDSVLERLLAADLFISTSRGEGLPISVLEAMACRRPVVLSDIPPHREIAEGVDFIPLVDPDDVAGFAREIERFRAMPAARRQQIGQQCRQLVEERFSLASMHAGYNAVYAQIAASSAPAFSESTRPRARGLLRRARRPDRGQHRLGVGRK
jgi:glycosyltransferase involved in cell wall biosynthesis